MYLVKNALKNLSRTKGRNSLIGIIVFVIAVSACLGLSIRRASDQAKEEASAALQITAQISIDREQMMQSIQKNGADGQEQMFDRSSFRENFQQTQALTIEELLTYAEASTVQSFDYSLTASVNGSDSFEPVETTESEEESEADASDSETGSTANAAEAQPASPNGRMTEQRGAELPQAPAEEKGKGGFRKGTLGTQGEFTLTGYSSDRAMTDFFNGVCTITEGQMFAEGTEEYQCVISDELALYNNIDLASNCAITITNPNQEEESYTLTVVGIYHNSQSTVTSGGRMGGFSTSTDPANQIYLSYPALRSILDASQSVAVTETDEQSGFETTTALPGQTAGTYSFATVEDYETFTSEAYELGLSEAYTITSSDVSAYEESLLPLEHLNQMALYFLLVVLGIGAVILIVLNIFSVRERKYEVGVLTAIGMRKYKVSLQFLVETLLVTLLAIVLGAAAGGAASLPVTNSLLETQVEAQQTEEETNSQAFGRSIGGAPGQQAERKPLAAPSSAADHFSDRAGQYISQVDSAMDLTVLLQLLGIGLGLALLASAASIIFIMRYQPLKILANRD